VSAATKTKAEPKPFRSGFCNRTLPRTPTYDPHQRCHGCDCECHTQGPDPAYEDMIMRVAARRAARTYPDTPWPDLTDAQRRHHLRSAREEVEMVTAELRVWEP
jgi:hypothetical protein